VRIAQQLGLSHATVSRVLRRLKLNRIRHLELQLLPNRYEHAAAGDLLHLDIKRLVRIQRPSHRVTGDRRDGVKGIGAESSCRPGRVHSGRGARGFASAQHPVSLPSITTAGTLRTPC
jgi:hypothetical protein